MVPYIVRDLPQRWIPSSITNKLVCRPKRAMWTYEVVTMIIAVLLSDTYLRFVITRLACSAEEILWKKLTSFVEKITGPLCAFACLYRSYKGRRAIATNVIDKNVDRVRVLANQLSCIILLFRFLNTALEISCKSFLSPRCVNGI